MTDDSKARPTARPVTGGQADKQARAARLAAALKANLGRRKQAARAARTADASAAAEPAEGEQ